MVCVNIFSGLKTEVSLNEIPCLSDQHHHRRKIKKVVLHNHQQSLFSIVLSYVTLFNQKHNFMKKLILFALPITFFFASCGGGAEKPAEESAKPVTEETSSQEASTPGEAKITIHVTGNSMADMAYEPASASVKAGDKVTLTLVNDNTAEGMLHNWVLVKMGSAQEVATAGISAGADKMYVPENPNIIAASGLANPNETITLEFTAPEAGSYNYICTYPGHFPKMIGKLIVE